MEDFLYFTFPTLILFSLLMALFVTLFILDHYKRSYPRKGFLPFSTTRGDRIFISIMSIVFVGILWLRFIPLPIELSLIIIVPTVIFIIVKG
ncbi:MAG: DUF2160 family membrane protein [Nitrososphaeria archaeon]